MMVTGLVVVAVGFLLNAFFGSTLETLLIDHTRAGLIRQVRLGALYVSDRLVEEHPDRVADFLGDRLEVRVTIVDSVGVVAGDSQVNEELLGDLDNHGSRPEVLQARDGGFGRSVRYSRTLGIDMLYVAGTVPARPGWILRFAIPMSELIATRSAVQGVLWVALLGGLLAVAVTSTGLSRVLTRHITYLSGVARKMAGGEFANRAELRGTIPEIRDLAAALNEMGEQTQGRIEQILVENSRLQAVLAGISEGILVTEKNGRIRMTNRQFNRLFGVQDPRTDGKMPIEFVRNPDVQNAVMETLETNEGQSLEIVLPGVLPRYLDVHTAPILQNETCFGSVTVFYDISEIRRLEQVRKDFVANVSHELRTPLTTIKGCAATLADGALSDPEAAKRFVDSINTHAGRLHNLVDDLLDLSQLESDSLAIDSQALDVKAIVASAVETVAPFAVDRGIEISSEVDEGLTAQGDPGLVRQAIVNLLDNAIKYTEKGTVSIQTRKGALADPNYTDIPFASPEPIVSPIQGDPYSGPSEERIYVEVADTGAGIPSEDLPRIFERFYRVDKGRSRALGGTGLGLAIVRHIVESHGQRVYVRSELGNGSTFGFSLPIR